LAEGSDVGKAIQCGRRTDVITRPSLVISQLSLSDLMQQQLCYILQFSSSAPKGYVTCLGLMWSVNPWSSVCDPESLECTDRLGLMRWTPCTQGLQVRVRPPIPSHCTAIIALVRCCACLNPIVPRSPLRALQCICLSTLNIWWPPVCWCGC
jgi:hypothetical protein